MSSSNDLDSASRVRKPRPEVKIYRPGSGPLRKRGTAENDQPDCTATSQQPRPIAGSQISKEAVTTLIAREAKNEDLRLKLEAKKAAKRDAEPVVRRDVSSQEKFGRAKPFAERQPPRNADQEKRQEGKSVNGSRNGQKSQSEQITQLVAKIEAVRLQHETKNAKSPEVGKNQSSNPQNNRGPRNNLDRPPSRGNERQSQEKDSNRNREMRDEETKDRRPRRSRGSRHSRRGKKDQQQQGSNETEDWESESNFYNSGRRSQLGQQSRCESVNSIRTEDDWNPKPCMEKNASGNAETWGNEIAGTRASSRAASRSSSVSNFIYYPESEPEPPDSPTMFMQRGCFSPPRYVRPLSSEPAHCYSGMASCPQPNGSFLQNQPPREDYYSSPRVEARPPSGRRDRPSFPANFSSLPPRLQRKFAEENLHHPPPAGSPAYPVGLSPSTVSGASSLDWDGSSLTFMGTGGFKQPRGRGQGSRDMEYPAVDVDDLDTYLVRARNQLSPGIAPDPRGNRRNSHNEPLSPSPAPISKISPSRQAATFEPCQAAPESPLEKKTQSPKKLDWSEEMDLEDQASQASSSQSSGKPAAVSTPRVSTPQNFNFQYTDVRYRDKPEAGILVFSKGGSQNVSQSEERVPADQPRPLIGQNHQPKPPNQNQTPTRPANQSQPQPSYNYPPPRAGGVLFIPQASQPFDGKRCDATRDSGSVRPPSQRVLYDPSNPHKPVMPNVREPPPSQQYQMNRFGPPQRPQENIHFNQDQRNPPEPLPVGGSRPAWYDPNSQSFRSVRCDPRILQDIKKADLELSMVVRGTGVLRNWERIAFFRDLLQRCLHAVLVSDIKFAETENLEQHVWKLSFHNVIEALRRGGAEDPEYKEQYKNCLLTVVDEGLSYFENLLDALQDTYNFRLDDYLEPHLRSMSGLGYVGLALVAAQKIFLFMGDLARYREATTETSNLNKARAFSFDLNAQKCSSCLEVLVAALKLALTFGSKRKNDFVHVCKTHYYSTFYWYNKANVLNPRNGRPYNQLALLALHARRRLDAVYLYMRSLMASNPFLSAKESLLSLFDENRKKFEQQDRKRRDEKDQKRRERLKLKESVGGQPEGAARNIRREIWFHPMGGKRFHRTTATPQEQQLDSDEEELNELTSADVNKRFVTSFLHVHGKLFTKTGMESFHDAAVQMLHEFRNLLQRTPLPVNQSRLVQLLALNMFALTNAEISSSFLPDGHRSAIHESALVVSLEMFNVILERCNILLKEQLDNPNSLAPGRLLNEDLQNLVPAVKVWSDWLLCHTSVWNPPPDTSDFHVGPPGTPWERLATLINLLCRVSIDVVSLTTEYQQGYEWVKLPEDIALAGFLPLMTNTQEPMFTRTQTDMDLAADCARVRRLLYFGRDYLCGIDPPVLKLHFLGPSRMEYVSAVGSQSSSAMDNPGTSSSQLQAEEDEILQSYSENDDEEETAKIGAGSEEILELRLRKEELERRHLVQERRKQHVKDIAREGVRVVIEIRPKFLVADTNCYIDHLAILRSLANEKNYTLIVPLVVLNELDGLGRSRLQREAQDALTFLREKNPHVRYVTSRGAPLPSIAFAMEEASDDQEAMTNDDRILQCCSSLARDRNGQEFVEDGVRHLRREVVLLTDDRNLRVKALARDVPVSDLIAFNQWATSSD